MWLLLTVSFYYLLIIYCISWGGGVCSAIKDIGHVANSCERLSFEVGGGGAMKDKHPTICDLLFPLITT